jgi:hypothetical protein
VAKSSGSEAESSEDETPTPKRRKTLCPHRPELVKVTNEEDAPPLAEDPRNYDLEEEDIRMSSPESSLVADDRDYDPGLEPAPAVVPPEQQVSSSRVTLDDPPSPGAQFLGFHLRPVAEILTASHSAFVEEIVRQSAEDPGNEEQLQNVLLLMSEVFRQVGRLLGRRHHGDKGKGKGCVL